MNSDNAVELANIDRDLDALIALTKNDGIDNDELVERLSNSVIELKDIYDRGGIDSKFMYDLAIDVSDKIESVDPGECFGHSILNIKVEVSSFRSIWLSTMQKT